MQPQTEIMKAGILVEALPYIRRFHGKTVVVKYGGAAMTEESLRRQVAQDLILMRYVGMNPVLVHGGGPEISRQLELLGLKSAFVDGLRVTDAATMEVVEMVLTGKVNREIVSALNLQGGRAVGLSGRDAGLLLARPYRPVDQAGRERDLGYVGEVERVAPEVVSDLVGAGYLPVVAPVGVDGEGQAWNLNADTVAGELAAALQAAKLVLLTDVEGILRRRSEPDSLISTLAADQAEELIAAGVIEGGMIPKVRSCVRAIRAGVGRVHIIDGRLPHSLLLEVFTDRGVGTMVVP
ncbi:MAG: acetylglutamate kinase [Thermaerobacter sp.]|nr:acetylglutamate kinase [Thermaerobacter sp.]MDA8146364.1 acetylglutamate kinase [Thermaerobacter sp.]